MVRVFRSLKVWLGGVALALTISGTAKADPATTVFLNGVPTPVYFNDGDSFRVLEGPLEGSKARLAGFNTLETFGPAHKWGGWHPRELYALSKAATLNARRGIWHCESKDLKRDGYGRILWHCLDLALDQVRNGYAHALSVDDAPANPAVLAAQRDAIVHRRGIWAKGTPTVVLTSIHSADEGAGDRTYNRLVSAVDGHSERWKHQDLYTECQDVCYPIHELSQEQALAVVALLRKDPQAEPIIRGIEDVYLALVVNTYAAFGSVPAVFTNQQRQVLADRLTAMQKDGRMPAAQERQGACMIHVDFKRRYAQPKPVCLKW